MQIKINLEPTSSELQLLTEGLRLLIQHLEDGKGVSIVGSDPQACLFAARALVDEIGLDERRGPGEYNIQKRHQDLARDVRLDAPAVAAQDAHVRLEDLPPSFLRGQAL